MSDTTFPVRFEINPGDPVRIDLSRETIKFLARRRGRTMASVADAVGVSPSTVSAILSGLKWSRPFSDETRSAVEQELAVASGLPVETIRQVTRPSAPPNNNAAARP